MANDQLSDIGACVFDAYGTLFDVAAAAAHCKDDLGDKMAPLAAMWRDKQLSYTWLRSLMGEYVDFWRVTQDGLDYSLAALGIDGEPALRQKLLDLYFKLDAYGEVKDVLTALKGAGLKTAILSNGAPAMLKAAVDNANIGGLLDDVLSVEDLGIYKPHPSVYQLAVDRLGVAAERICFMSSNAWDAAGAGTFGFKVVWVNRFKQPPERLPGAIVTEIDSLRSLPGLLGVS
ncbi:MAG: haloacid dehalogenase type II [Rhodospirillales bacterium CG15_BIG_FIL_POST_REV_8_21_14_020_66_15]|nr:MAG: haloacid dehalogenase type II [Rhodospirillales bacterium CG15_BIG_FIL_POST_REV_8_21_14_020_66_15]